MRRERRRGRIGVAERMTGEIPLDVLLVDLGAVAAVVWIVWYFWLAEKG